MEVGLATGQLDEGGAKEDSWDTWAWPRDQEGGHPGEEQMWGTLSWGPSGRCGEGTPAARGGRWQPGGRMWEWEVRRQEAGPLPTHRADSSTSVRREWRSG